MRGKPYPLRTRGTRGTRGARGAGRTRTPRVLLQRTTTQTMTMTMVSTPNTATEMMMAVVVSWGPGTDESCSILLKPFSNSIDSLSANNALVYWYVVVPV